MLFSESRPLLSEFTTSPILSERSRTHSSSATSSRFKHTPSPLRIDRHCHNLIVIRSSPHTSSISIGFHVTLLDWRCRCCILYIGSDTEVFNPMQPQEPLGVFPRIFNSPFEEIEAEWQITLHPKTPHAHRSLAFGAWYAW